MQRNIPEWCKALECYKFSHMYTAEKECMLCPSYKPPLVSSCNGGSTPSQYALPEGATQLQDLIEYREMNGQIMNIFKACYRIGTKNDIEYELNKILWFADREKKRIMGEASWQKKQ